MVEEAKKWVIREFSKSMNKMSNGYSVDITPIIDKIYYIMYLEQQ